LLESVSTDIYKVPHFDIWPGASRQTTHLPWPCQPAALPANPSLKSTTPPPETADVLLSYPSWVARTSRKRKCC